jgi:putative nucleotidyltransferase with HDIG domain
VRLQSTHPLSQRQTTSWRAAAWQAVVTALAFKLLADFSAGFAESSGASYLFPPSAVILAAGGGWGWPGVVGVFAGSLLSRWGAATTIAGALAFACVHGITAAIPAVMLRRPSGTSGWRLLRAVSWGVVGNNLVSAIAGTGVLIALGMIPSQVDAAANNLFHWWTSDLMAALSLGLPLLLVVRRSTLLGDGARELLAHWLEDRRQIAAVAALLAVSISGLWLLDLAGWGFPHWAAVALIAPLALAAFGGGVGAALLVNLVASSLYFALLLTGRQAQTGVSTVQLLAPAYLILVFFASFALVGGVLAGRNRILLRRVAEQERMLRQDFERIVVALSGAIEAKDPTTEGHVQRVAALSVEVGRRMGLGEPELSLLRYSALLHDVGKIGVPESVLNKPGPLDAEERVLMEAHVEIGVRILSGIDLLTEVVPLIRYHQERWDGVTSGVRYPGYFGLAGEQIPAGSRILAVVDAFDAITHDRPYRAGQPAEVGLAELRRESGKQFDPRAVEALTALVEEGWLNMMAGPDSRAGKTASIGPSLPRTLPVHATSPQSSRSTPL